MFFYVWLLFKIVSLLRGIQRGIQSKQQYCGLFFLIFFKVYFGKFKFVDKTAVVSALVNRKIKTENQQ